MAVEIWVFVHLARVGFFVVFAGRTEKIRENSVLVLASTNL